MSERRSNSAKIMSSDHPSSTPQSRSVKRARRTTTGPGSSADRTATRGRRPRKRHLQLRLDQARKPDGKHGGWRPGAGRKRKPGAVSHAERPSERADLPQHVTLRVLDGVESLADGRSIKIIRNAIRASHKGGFRITEFNVLGNHLHLITQAESKRALSTGIQGLTIRIARRTNAARGRRGKLFAHRYHARYLNSPREVRNALRYVLLNRRHHAAEKRVERAPATTQAPRFSRYWIDPWSSAAWFDGWAQPIRFDEPWKRELLAMTPPTLKPTVWLLTTGWKRHGLLRFDEVCHD
jgi:REP element-mobilizing transposase RayT